MVSSKGYNYVQFNDLDKQIKWLRTSHSMSSTRHRQGAIVPNLQPLFWLSHALQPTCHHSAATQSAHVCASLMMETPNTQHETGVKKSEGDVTPTSRDSSQSTNPKPRLDKFPIFFRSVDRSVWDLKDSTRSLSGRSVICFFCNMERRWKF